MPYTNVPEELWGKMDDCKDKVMAQGHDEQSAIAICHASIMEGKSIDTAITEFHELKAGARHSKEDRELVRKIRKASREIQDMSVALEPDDEDKAPEAPAPPPEIVEIPMKEIDQDAVIIYGDAIKALGDGRVGGYLVRFTTDAEPDLTGEFFTKDTDFGDLDSAAVYYNHGLDPVLRKRKLGKATLKMDDFGVWAETQLSMRDEYEKFIYQMTEAGKQGWSSGTAPHLVEKQPKGKAVWIKTWPLGLDASVTPTPAEYRNAVIPLKSLEVKPLMESKPIDAAVPEKEAQEGEQKPAPTTKSFREEKTMEITPELQELLSTTAKTAAEEALKALPAKMTDVKVVTDEADKPISAGEFFQAVKTAYLYPGHEDPRLRPLKAAQGLSEGSPSDGGYLLAPQIAGGLIERMYGGGEILRRVANDTIGPNSNSMLYNAVDESSRATGSRWGGVRGYWLAEAGTLTGSHPNFRQMELKLKKVAALCYATDELLADATALESWLTRTVPEELRFMVEDAIFEGDGLGKPLGVLNAPCLVTPLREGATLVSDDDLANMWARRWTGANDYVWLVSASVFPQLVTMSVGNFPVFIPSGNVAGKPFNTIYGAPVIETEYNPALGGTGDITLASLSQYQTITKGGIQSASSIHVQFTTDETAFRFIYRIDGQPMWHSALTPFNAGDTISPFVALSSASS